MSDAYDLAFDHLRSTSTKIAVVGANNHPRKYGNIIFKDLLARGYTVYPVNLHEPTVEGHTAYRTLADLPEPVDIVDVVTPPASTLQVLKDAAEAKLPLVWLQDGSFDDRVLAQAADAPFKTVYDACI